MAIFIFTPNDNPMNHSEVYCADVSSTIKIPEQPTEVDFCYCDFECDFEEYKFVNLDGDSSKHDKSSFIAELSSSGSGTIGFELFKSGLSLGVIVDDTYGIFNAVGSISEHPLKSTFVLDWGKVYSLHGAGEYYLIITEDNYGRVVNTKTHTYKLSNFTVKSADKTIVLKSIQNGYIIGGLDYTGLNFEQEFRLEGKLLEQTPELIKDSYQNTSYKWEQIQDEVKKSYILEINMIPSSVSNQLIENNILGCELFVSDYNVWNGAGVFRDLPVDPVSFGNAEYYDRNLKGNFEIELRERTENLIKRRFK